MKWDTLLYLIQSARFSSLTMVIEISTQHLLKAVENVSVSSILKFCCIFFILIQLLMLKFNSLSFVAKCYETRFRSHYIHVQLEYSNVICTISSMECLLIKRTSNLFGIDYSKSNNITHLMKITFISFN